ncbi:MAG TPA: response regulator transcription factor [Candidatus Fimadaptatus faecigallinarum]|uniref:Stage 0 sporulation protein A homolog n=1 Tax=Candidatus Fimadaptatus faecigallinarum TaxID=2840814 RepID=A0A9D1LSU7_9FIRM|nr:response regulator transcription factor [Candidatus Fimadaptatus faecigallinarum]
MARILLVEDEKMLARYVELELTHEGYEVDVANDGREGLDKALEDKHDLMLLDLMLPRLSGIEICRRVRQHSTKPIIMLTAKDDVSDKVMGLDMGADDYVTKPFAIEELLARIRVALKHGERARTGADSDGRLSAGPLVVNPRNRQVSFGGEEVALTKTEFDMLAYMVAHQDKVLSRDELLSEVWGYSYAGDTNIVDVYVRYLRQKLDEKYGVKLLHTVRGVGYLFKYEQ